MESQLRNLASMAMKSRNDCASWKRQSLNCVRGARRHRAVSRIKIGSLNGMTSLRCWRPCSSFERSTNAISTYVHRCSINKSVTLSRARWIAGDAKSKELKCSQYMTDLLWCEAPLHFWESRDL